TVTQPSEGPHTCGSIYSADLCTSSRADEESDHAGAPGPRSRVPIRRIDSVSLDRSRVSKGIADLRKSNSPTDLCSADKSTRKPALPPGSILQIVIKPACVWQHFGPGKRIAKSPPYCQDIDARHRA